MRQYSGFGDAGASNERFRSLIANGQTGLSVAFDLPTQLGYDSDDPSASAEVGRVGVAIDTLDDLERLFSGIPLEVANPSFTINAPAPVLAAMYIALARRQKADMTKLRATFQNDILKEFLSRGAYVFPPGPSVKLVIDVIEYCSREAPSVYPISVCGSHIRDTGATGADAMATTLANALTYLDEAVRRGMDPIGIASRFSFLFAARQDIFFEAALVRAARRLWATTLKKRYAMTDPNALKFRLFNATSNQMFTRQEPLNNIVRGTLGVLGVVLGGAQAVTCIGYDEAYDIPSQESQLVALRTQQIIAYETQIPATVDPLAGSYYVETLTNQIEDQLRGFMETLDEMGGVVPAIESGWLHGRIYDRAYDLEMGIAEGTVPVVGVNLFASPNSKDETLFPLDGELHHQDDGVAGRQSELLRKHRASRDSDAVALSLEEVRKAASSGQNVVWPIEGAVTCGATVAECMTALRDVFGTYQEGGRY
jgi:methylmalonyl-CoA mutase N-terminal domain/subunit